MNCKLIETIPIRMQLKASPKTIGVESELSSALRPTRSYSTVRVIQPVADCTK